MLLILPLKAPAPVTKVSTLAQDPPMINRVSTVHQKMTTLNITLEHKLLQRVLQPAGNLLGNPLNLSSLCLVLE